MGTVQCRKQMFNALSLRVGRARRLPGRNRRKYGAERRDLPIQRRDLPV